MRQPLCKLKRYLLGGGALLVVMAAPVGCNGKGDDVPAGEGFFSRYDFGNEKDRAEIRKDRPEYQDYD